MNDLFTNFYTDTFIETMLYQYNSILDTESYINISFIEMINK